MKAHKCLQKLQESMGSEVDEDVQARFAGSTSSLTLLVEETMEKAITITMFLWCTRPCIGKNKLVFPLFAAPTRQGTLSLFFSCCSSVSKGSLRKALLLHCHKLFLKISQKYLGSGPFFGIVRTKCPG